MRQLFADKISEGDEELLTFLSLEDNDGDIQAKANVFRTSGVYDKMLGDLIIKTCAEILQVTIVLVTSNESVPRLLYVPNQFPVKSLFLLHQVQVTMIPHGMQKKVSPVIIVRRIHHVLDGLLQNCTCI